MPDFVTQSYIDGLEMRSEGVGAAINYLKREFDSQQLAAMQYWLCQLKLKISDLKVEKVKQDYENRDKSEELKAEVVKGVVRNIRTLLSRGLDAILEESAASKDG